MVMLFSACMGFLLRKMLDKSNIYSIIGFWRGSEVGYYFHQGGKLMQNISKLPVIGAGKMGQTLIKALLEANLLSAAQIVATIKHASRVDEVAARLRVPITVDNRAAVSGADVILLCVKPQALREILAEIKPVIGSDQLVVSIAASATTSFIERHLDKSVPVVRTMPNTQ